MKLANSAAFPSLMPATTLEMAVGRLGADGLSTALLEMAARDVLEGRHPRVKEAMRRIWPYALGVALMTQEICETIGREDDAANGRLAGLLHDAGKPLVGALLLEIEQQMQRSGTRATVTSIPPAAFQDAIDACHRPFSAALAAAWETPGAVALAITAAEGWDVRDAHALGNVLRFAGAYTKRLGITIGSYRAAETDRVFAEGRALLGLDDQTMKRLGHGFKERTIVLSGIRG